MYEEMHWPDSAHVYGKGWVCFPKVGVRVKPHWWGHTQKIRLTCMFTVYARLLSASHYHLDLRNLLYQILLGVITISRYLYRKVPEILISNAVTRVPTTPSIFMLPHKKTTKSMRWMRRFLLMSLMFCSEPMLPAACGREHMYSFLEVGHCKRMSVNLLSWKYD